MENLNFIILNFYGIIFLIKSKFDYKLEAMIFIQIF